MCALEQREQERGLYVTGAMQPVLVKWPDGLYFTEGSNKSHMGRFGVI